MRLSLVWWVGGSWGGEGGLKEGSKGFPRLEFVWLAFVFWDVVVSVVLVSSCKEK